MRNLQTAHEVRLQQSERECRSRLEREFGEALAKAQAEAAEGREAERRRLQLERQLQESRQQVQALARAGEEHVAQSELLLSAVQTVRTAQTAVSLSSAVVHPALREVKKRAFTQSARGRSSSCEAREFSLVQMNNDEETERSRPLSELRPLVMTLVDVSDASGWRSLVCFAVSVVACFKSTVLAVPPPPATGGESFLSFFFGFDCS